MVENAAYTPVSLKHRRTPADNPRVKSRSFPFASLLLPAVLAGLVLLAPAPARAWDWPRLGLYGCVFGNG